MFNNTQNNQQSEEHLDMNRIPEHVAIIMDGNGRWAKKRHMPRIAAINVEWKPLRRLRRLPARWGLRY